MIRKISAVVLFSAASLLLSATASAAGSSPAISEMAKIVSNIAHYPSDKDKETLRGIVSNEKSTAGERTIANALLNMDHQVSSGDKTKLQELSKDASATPQEHELAEIVASLNHKATDKDKERLKKLE